MTERAPAAAPLRPDEIDAVLKAKLAVPERHLKHLHKKLSQIACATESADLAHHLASFRLELDLFMLQLQRIDAVARETTVAEVKAYKIKIEDMEREREDTLQSIEQLKKELVEVQQDRKNKLEYDQLASEIMRYGTREELGLQLKNLEATIDSLSGESSKYSDIMTQSKDRFERIASELKELRADVGFEVGERERREVEREGEGDAEEDARADGEAEAAAAASTTAATTVNAAGTSHTRESSATNTEGEGSLGGGRDGKTRLNPAAAVFTPHDTGRGPSKPTSQKRRRPARPSGEDDDEEDAGIAKKRAREEGEMSEGDAEEEEEEGAA